jgi:DNA-binding winged helix-turn-helix (wHTH) protein/Tfp pilus assembly protein PilF
MLKLLPSLSTNTRPTPQELYEFGPFRVDAQREILLRAGEPVPLTPKTFQILLVLVRHNQEVVTKDDLMKAVWPDTFVEEANLSRNIFMLRRALGESPQDHRYVLTVPGRGYRLAETVRLIADQEFSLIAAEHSTVQVEVKESKPWRWIAGAVGLLVIAGALLLKVSWPHRSPVLSSKDTVVLADFANSTGDPVFDETLRQGVAVQLQESPFLSVTSEERVRQTLKQMQQPADARLTPEVAREVCERTGGAAVLEGSIARLGTLYVLGLRARYCRTGDVLDEEQMQAVRKEDVLNALGRMTSNFRTHAGESLAGINKHSTALAQATTPSLDALKAYSTGRNTAFANGFAAAVPHLRRAVALDPQFAMAHGFLGLMYSNLGMADLARESTSRAYQLRERASDRERFYIEFLYDRQVTGNHKKAQQTLELWAETYPRDSQPLSFLAGRVTESSGEYEKGINAALKDLELNPDDTFGYDSLAFQYLHLGQLTDVRKTLKRAAERKLENPDFLVIRFFLAFLEGDREGMQREVYLANGRPGVEDLLAHHQAFVLAYSGHVYRAEMLWQRAVELTQQTGNREKAAMYESSAAVCWAFFGNRTAARRHARAALELTKGRDVEYGAGLALQLSGDSFHAQALAHDLEERFPEDTSVQFSYLPTLRALFALDQGDHQRALEQLQPAIPYDEALPGTGFSAKFGSLYTAYVRGEAYLAAQRGPEAAAEFRKILDHPSLVLADPAGAIAQWRLGKALALSGDRAKARSMYLSFLTSWKDADADVPILKQAKTEYDLLR